MRVFILFALLVSTPFLVLSQTVQSYCVSGTITDSLSAPVAWANVSLYPVASIEEASGNIPSDALLKSTISDRNGKFVFPNIPVGEFILIVSHISYKSQTISCNVAGNVELPTMVLANHVQMMSEVTILRNKITQYADRYTISLRSDPITNGKTASEVLNFLPAVSSREGDLTIFGKGVSRVRINGVLIEDRKELEAIQADKIDNVEVVYLSGIDDMAAGSGGEINIRLKKTVDGGFYGSVAGNTTMNFKYGNTNNGVNSSFNYGRKKWSIYNYTGYNYNNQFLDQGYLVRYHTTNQNNNQTDRTRGWNNDFSTRLSITYDINARHMLGTNLRYSRLKNAPNFHSVSRFTDNGGNELDRSQSEYNALILNNQYQASLHYRWKLDSNGSEFNLQGDYLSYQTDNDRRHRNTFRLGHADENTEYMNNMLDNNVQMYYVDAKLTIKAGEKGKIEAGVNYNANRTNQVLEYSDLVNDNWVVDDDLSDHYRLRGDNYAAFASFSSSIGQRLTYQVGLRGELRRINYNSVALDLDNTKNYNTLGVQANLMYMLNPQKSRMLMLAYMRGSNDMPYAAITPVVTYLDEYTYNKGNIDLKPVTFDIVMLNFMLNTKWTFRLAGGVANNMQYNGVFTDPEDPRITYIMPINAGRKIMGSFYAEYKFKVVKWWGGSANVLWELIKTDTPDENFTGKKWQFNVKNNFNWGNGWGGTLNIYLEPTYRSEVNRKLKTELSLFGNIYKTLLDGKWRINLQGSLFNISRDNITYTSDIWRRFYNDTHRYALTLGLTYNFIGGKKVSVKQTSSQQSYYETLNTTKE